jgi:hypothetical protein
MSESGRFSTFITRLNSTDGSLQWAENLSTTGNCRPQGIAWANGSLALHGSINDTVHMDNIVLIAHEDDPFVARFSPADGTVWSAETFAGLNDDQGYGIDAKGNRLVVSGNSASPALTIGDFNLAGTSKSFYFAQKILPAPLAAGIVNTTNVTCHGGSDGTATVAVSGGAAPYTYAWSNGAADTTAFNLPAGNFTVTVTDDTGFQVIASATITEPQMLDIQASNIINVSCAGLSDAQITVAATGGTPPFTYMWSNGSTGVSATNLSSETYTATATDSHGCQTTTSVSVTEPQVLQIQTSGVVNVSCVGLSDGQITVAATGGTPPFTYTWSNGALGPGASNLSAGTYTVTLADANNCIQTHQEIVTAEFDDAPIADFTSNINGTTASFSNISANATSYLWVFGDGQTSQMENPVHDYVESGTYSVILIAYNPCGADSVLQTIGIVSATEVGWLKNLLLYPNPSNGIFSLEMSGEEVEEVEFSLFGADGKLLRRETADFGSGMLSRTFNYGDLPPALYLLRIRAGVKSTYLKISIQ